MYNNIDDDVFLCLCIIIRITVMLDDFEDNNNIPHLQIWVGYFIQETPQNIYMYEESTL